MTAPAHVLDGIVTVELSLDRRHEVEHVVACLRAGALAWEASPGRGVVDVALRPADVQRVLDFAQEIEDEARRVSTAREAHHRETNKASQPKKEKKR